jgi:hypothetical protein
MCTARRVLSKKEIMPESPGTHRFVYRKYLVVNNLSPDLGSVLKRIITIMNMLKICPLIALPSRLLQRESSSESKTLLFYNKAYCLTRSKMLHVILKKRL